MKKCGKCLKEKEESDFYQYKGQSRAWCKDCDKINTIIRQRIFKEKCLQYKGGKCENCGYDKYIGALEFHHVDPKKKKFGIASAKLREFNQKVINELDKCELLCANCHREQHQKYDDEIINGLWEWYQERREKHNLIQKEEFRCKCGSFKSKKEYSTCLNCSRKTNNLDIQEVLDKLKEFNYNWSKTGRYFNLSDNGLRKFVSSHGYNPKELRCSSN